MLKERLVSLRKEKRLSQYEAAEKLGFSRGKLANYEQGSRQPDYDTLKHIADFYNVTTDYLLGRSDEPELSEKHHKDYIEIKEILDQMEREGRLKELESLKAYTKFLADALEKDN